jgi:hypothetical protein
LGSLASYGETYGEQLYGWRKYLALPASGASIDAFNNPTLKNAVAVQNVNNKKPIANSSV